MNREPAGRGWTKTALRMRPEFMHGDLTVRVGASGKLYVSRKGAPLTDEDLDFVADAFNAGRPECRFDNASTCVLDCGGRG